MPDEVNKFLEDLPVADEQKDPFAQPEVPVEESKADDPELQPESVKDRRHRRLETRLNAEREANIELNARLSAISEVQKFRNDSASEGKLDETISRIYGTNTPEGAEATRLLQKALEENSERATQKALEIIRQEREQENQQVAQEEKTLNSFVDEIEDEFNVDLTSSDRGRALQRQYFAYLERMSPKDKNGNIKDYADPIATWEEFQEKLSRKNQADTNRAKDLGSRSMVRSGASADSKLEASVQERFLKDAGII